MIINHNMASINANNVLKFKTVDVTRDAQKLASGLRINRAADDASGLAVSEKMRSQIRGLNQAEKNIQDGVAMIQAAEGYLQETTDVVQRIRELAVQASNGTYSSEDRVYIQVEVSQLVDEVNRIASHAQFNGRNLLDGTFTAEQGSEEGGLMLHVGANMDQRRSMSIGSMKAEDLKIAEVKISNVTDSNATIGSVDEALRLINKQRADLGAYQNRFE
jgi:flagellin